VLRLGKELREVDRPKESDWMFVLDTDHLGILERQTAPQFGVLMRRISQQPEANFFVTIIRPCCALAKISWPLPVRNADGKRP
jgi:hypothetical protein